MAPYEILLYYKYATIEDPGKFLFDHTVLCKKLGLKGRIIISQEGINGTVEGLRKNTQEYVDVLKADPRFADMDIKRGDGTNDGTGFPRLSIKLRPEIVRYLPSSDVCTTSCIIFGATATVEPIDARTGFFK